MGCVAPGLCSSATPRMGRVLGSDEASPFTHAGLVDHGAALHYSSMWGTVPGIYVRGVT